MCVLMEARGQANQGPLPSLSFVTLGKCYDKESIGYKFMPYSNLNIKTGYCAIIGNAGKTLFI